MTAAALARQYGSLTPEERFRLIFAAAARDDEAERDRLARAGGRIHLSLSDHAPHALAFGELALLDAEARSASAVALGPVVAFRIDQEDFYDVLEECAEVVRSIMRVLCQRLRRQNEKMQVP